MGVDRSRFVHYVAQRRQHYRNRSARRAASDERRDRQQEESSNHEAGQGQQVRAPAASQQYVELLRAAMEDPVSPSAPLCHCAHELLTSLALRDTGLRRFNLLRRHRRGQEIDCAAATRALRWRSARNKKRLARADELFGEHCGRHGCPLAARIRVETDERLHHVGGAFERLPEGQLAQRGEEYDDQRRVSGERQPEEPAEPAGEDPAQTSLVHDASRR